jgi:hypothetical protein
MDLTMKRESSRQVWAACLCLSSVLHGSENAPRKPFGEWVDTPEKKDFSLRLWYQEAEAYHIWDGERMHDVTVDKHGENYGIDRTQGVISMEYGITSRWAADLNLGYGTVGTRSFNAGGDSESTTGLLDTTLGVRYLIFREGENVANWVPTITFRAGAVLPGSYDQDFPFAPGNSSAAIEPGFLFKKHFGWQGFSLVVDTYYRWMRTSGDDQYMASASFLQEIKSWRINVGYRHFQQLSGYNLDFNGVGQPLAYSPQVREISDSIEAGFSYSTSKHKVMYGFHCRTTLDGSNTDSAFWLGGYVQIPFHF